MSIRNEIIDLLKQQRFEAVTSYGDEGLAVLKELIQSDSSLLAPRAVHAASCFDPTVAITLLQETARSRDRVLKVAAAVCAAKLGESGRQILNYLNRSRDPSIKKWAERGLEQLGGTTGQGGDI